jgi:glycosyltransferase involved in cell wall biosynthesis
MSLTSRTGRESFAADSLPPAPPALSVLVPTHNQPAGLERVLGSLASLRDRPDVEILVSDDSSDDEAAARILAACEAFGGVHYRRNRPGLGAIHNWNVLLDRARGDYCWLLHHDEALAEGSDLPAMLDDIAARRGPDAWILACRVVHTPGSRPLQHVPAAWAVAIAQRWPGYLLRRNLFGPPSVIVARRSRYPRFDPRLQWRVDVEAYVRLLMPPFELRAWPLGGLVSHKDRTNSITAHLASRLVAIENQEYAILVAVHGQNKTMRLWLGPQRTAPALRALEFVLWSGFRATYRAGQHLAGLWR